MSGFLDSSIVLDLVADDARAHRFEVLTSGLAFLWCTSPLVRMESRVRVLAEDDRVGQARVEAILRATVSLPLTDEVFDRAASFRARYGFKSLDALHLATALTHGCAEFWTADARLSRVPMEGLAVRLVA